MSFTTQQYHYILCFVGIVFAACLLYYIYKDSKNSSEHFNNTDVLLGSPYVGHLVPEDEARQELIGAEARVAEAQK